jgi:hypothetical protein
MPPRRLAPLLLAAGLLLLFVLLFASPCRAADDDLRPSVSVESQYTGNARLSGDSGSVAFSTERVTATMLPLTLEYDVSDYSWRNISRLPFGDKRSKPWSTLQMLSATFDYARDLAGGLGFFTEATVFAGYEEELSDSLGLNLTGGLSYAFTPALKLSFGATGLFHEVHSRPLPVVRLDWNQNAKEGFSASVGFPENTLSYRFDKTYNLRLAQTFDDTIYRLSNESSIGPKGYLESVGVVSGLYLDYTPLPGLTGSIGPQYVLRRKFNTYTPAGDKRDVFSLDNAWGGLAHLEYAF